VPVLAADPTAATLAGLALALLGPPAVALLGRRGGAGGLGPALAGQAALAAIAHATVAIVLFWEGRPLGSLGFGAPFFARSLPLGLVLGAGFVLLLGPLLMRLPGWLGLPGFEAGLSALHRLPRWYLAVAACVGGTVEDILYRGYAFGRLAALAGSPWAAGIAVVAAFALAHLPLWGPGPAMATAVSGAVLTAAYAWSGDLTANILAHVATDAVGILGGRGPGPPAGAQGR
jgi:CAAX protease family protein